MAIDTVVERVSIGGNLFANLALINVNTWQTSQEVWQAGQSGAVVEGVNTANMGIYRLVDGEAVFDLLGKPGNLFIDDKFRKDAYCGIADNEFFFPNDKMKQHVLSAIKDGKSVTIDYSKLNMKTDDCGSNDGYVKFGKKNTKEEKKLLSAVYGTDNPGTEKAIYLLREDVVKAQLENRKNDLIARACFLDYFQYFGADGRFIGNGYGAVRGVRRVNVADKGDAQKSEAAGILPMIL